MERTYVYDHKAYQNKVALTGYIMVAIFLYSIYRLVAHGLSILWPVILLVSGYSILNTFVTKSNPREVSVTDETITFRSYGEKTFRIDRLKLFRVKMVSPNYQVYVRAADEDGNKGSFWITYPFFTEKMDLLDEFNFLEKKTHPLSLRFSGREEMGVCRPHEKAEEASGA